MWPDNDFPYKEDTLAQDIPTLQVALPDPEKILKGDPGHSDRRGLLERLRDDFISRQLGALQQRSLQTGSVRTIRPSISSSTDAHPIQVARSPEAGGFA